MIFSLLFKDVSSIKHRLLRVTVASFASAVGARIYRHFLGSATRIAANFESFFPHAIFTNVLPRFHAKDYFADTGRSTLPNHAIAPSRSLEHKTANSPRARYLATGLSESCLRLSCHSCAIPIGSEIRTGQAPCRRAVATPINQARRASSIHDFHCSRTSSRTQRSITGVDCNLSMGSTTPAAQARSAGGMVRR